MPDEHEIGTDITVIDTEKHGTVILLSAGGAIGIEDDTITVYKTGAAGPKEDDGHVGLVALDRDSEWAQLTRDEAGLLVDLLAEKFSLGPE